MKSRTKRFHSASAARHGRNASRRKGWWPSGIKTRQSLGCNGAQGERWRVHQHINQEHSRKLHKCVCRHQQHKGHRNTKTGFTGAVNQGMAGARAPPCPVFFKITIGFGYFFAMDHRDRLLLSAQKGKRGYVQKRKKQAQKNCDIKMPQSSLPK